MHENCLQVTFPRIPKDGEDPEAAHEEGETVTRVLFPANNPYPQKRTIKFARLATDMVFRVHYGDVNGSLKRFV